LEKLCTFGGPNLQKKKKMGSSRLVSKAKWRRSACLNGCKLVGEGQALMWNQTVDDKPSMVQLEKIQ
jgi:hypothetical protein